LKILLTGKNGQVGFELQRALSTMGRIHAVGSEDCNLGDVSAVRQLVRSVRPDLIINTAAYTAVDSAENDLTRALAVNFAAPRVLAEEAERIGGLLVHFSTDYVFDGTTNDSYSEDDLPNPQTVYGLTKLAGDLAVQSSCTRFVILRTSWVLGTHGTNFAKTILRLAAQKDELNIVSDQYGVPTTAAFLADLTADLIGRYQQEPLRFPYGLYHAVPQGDTNWHAYACHIVDRARLSGFPICVPSVNIRAVNSDQFSTAARRPANSKLNNTKIQETFNLEFPRWQEGVNRVLDNLLGGR